MIKSNPFYLTDEEIKELRTLFPPSMSWDSDYGYKNDRWDREYGYKSKKKHEWQATLLLTTTAYDCKHCGVKKEDAKDKEYCSSKDNDDTGGW